MPIYLVTYDLNKETKRPPIVEKVKEFDWAQLSESSYAISTPLSADEVYKAFQPFLDDNDTFYAITLRGLYAGFGPEEVNQWLESHIPLQ